MNEEVCLMMMPICVCGHVFRELSLSLNYTNLPPEDAYNPNMLSYKTIDVKYNPETCPKCGRIIRQIKSRDLSYEQFKPVTINFITHQDKPHILNKIAEKKSQGEKS